MNFENLQNIFDKINEYGEIIEAINPDNIEKIIYDIDNEEFILENKYEIYIPNNTITDFSKSILNDFEPVFYDSPEAYYPFKKYIKVICQSKNEDEFLKSLELYKNKIKEWCIEEVKCYFLIDNIDLEELYNKLGGKLKFEVKCINTNKYEIIFKKRDEKVDFNSFMINLGNKLKYIIKDNFEVIYCKGKLDETIKELIEK